jgi:hypothetical protein
MCSKARKKAGSPPSILSRFSLVEPWAISIGALITTTLLFSPLVSPLASPAAQAQLLPQAAFSKAVKTSSNSNTSNTSNKNQTQFNFTSLSGWQKELQHRISEQKPLGDLLDLEAVFTHLLSANSSSSDNLAKVALEQGRVHFAKNRFTEAIEAYSRVGRESEFWLEALEEKGWAYFRRGEFNQALAQIKTLHAPQLVQVTDPDSFYLSLLTRLRICDYLGIIQTIELLKNSQRERFQEIEKLAKGERTEGFEQFLAQRKNFPLKKAALGRSILSLPRLFHRDLKIQELSFRLELVRIFEQGEGSEMARQSSRFASFRDELIKSRAQIETRLIKRVQLLAQEAHEAHTKLLQRVALFEVELLQRLYTDREANLANYQTQGSIELTRNQISFPLEDRPWIDELGNIQTQVQACPRERRRL